MTYSVYHRFQYKKKKHYEKKKKSNNHEFGLMS